MHVLLVPHPAPSGRAPSTCDINYVQSALMFCQHGKLQLYTYIFSVQSLWRYICQGRRIESLFFNCLWFITFKCRRTIWRSPLWTLGPSSHSCQGWACLTCVVHLQERQSHAGVGHGSQAPGIPLHLASPGNSHHPGPAPLQLPQAQSWLWAGALPICPAFIVSKRETPPRHYPGASWPTK